MSANASSSSSNAQTHTNSNTATNAGLGMNADASQFAPYAMSGGRVAPRKAKKRATKASPKKAKPQHKIYIGPSGGKYRLRKGRKVYLC